MCISREEGAQENVAQRPLIISFWHACILPATYLFRNVGIRVMSSNSYDGEYMGRIIHKFGFVAVKGSSSRNAVRALLGLRRALQQGWAVAFSIDGPRGPRYKVKPGPVVAGAIFLRSLGHISHRSRRRLGAQHVGSADHSKTFFPRADAFW